MSWRIRPLLVLLLAAGALPAACMMEMGPSSGLGDGAGGGGSGGGELGGKPGYCPAFGPGAADTGTVIVGFPPDAAWGFEEEQNYVYGRLPVGDSLLLAVVRYSFSMCQDPCSPADTVRDVEWSFFHPYWPRGDTAAAVIAEVSNGIALVRTVAPGTFGMRFRRLADPEAVFSPLYGCAATGGSPEWVDLIRVVPAADTSATGSADRGGTKSHAPLRALPRLRAHRA